MPTAPPAAAAPQGTPAGPASTPYPAPGAQAPSFLKYEQQADGSLAAMIDGAQVGLEGDVFLQRYDPPRIPKAYQPAAQPAGQPQPTPTGPQGPLPLGPA